MARMGHDSERAALIYQHPTREADRRIADAMNAKITEARRQQGGEPGEPITAAGG